MLIFDGPHYSISPYVTQILVSGRRVAVGTVGQSFTLFDKPMTPAEIQHAIYTKVNSIKSLLSAFCLHYYCLQQLFVFTKKKIQVQPFNMISAVLQQELLLYCGNLIASNPELFSGILVVRMG